MHQQATPTIILDWSNRTLALHTSTVNPHRGGAFITFEKIQPTGIFPNEWYVTLRNQPGWVSGAQAWMLKKRSCPLTNTIRLFANEVNNGVSYTLFTPRRGRGNTYYADGTPASWPPPTTPLPQPNWYSTPIHSARYWQYSPYRQHEGFPPKRYGGNHGWIPREGEITDLRR